MKLRYLSFSELKHGVQASRPALVLLWLAADASIFHPATGNATATARHASRSIRRQLAKVHRSTREAFSY